MVKSILNLKKISTETFWVAMGSGGSVLSMLVGVRLLTTWLNPNEYGLLALAVSISVSIKNSIGYGIANAAARYFSIAQESNSYNEYWACLRKVFLIILSISLLSYCLIVIIGIVSKSHNILMWGGAIFWGGLLSLDTSMDGPINGARKRISFCWHRNLLNWGRFLIAYILVVYIKPTAFWVMIGFILASILTLVSKLYYIDKLRRATIKIYQGGEYDLQTFTSKFYSYLFPAILIGFFTWIQLFADRWSLFTFANKSDIGIYFALYQISFSPGVILAAFLFNLTGPVLFKATGNMKSSTKYKNAIRYNNYLIAIIAVFYSIIFLVMLIFKEEIGGLLLGELFRTHLTLLPWLLISGGLFSIGQQLFMTSYMNLKLINTLIFRGILALASFIIIMLGGMLNGVIGVTIALSFISAIFLIGAVYCSKIKTINVASN